MVIPSELPVLIFTTKEKNVNKDGKSNITFYQTQLDRISSHKLITLEGHHYLHWTRYKEMSEYVTEFTENYLKDL